MILNFKKIGSGRPLIILHGLFGSLDNWLTIGKKLGENFEVYMVDQRNHGQSPHSEQWDYDEMANDLLEFIETKKLQDVVLLGHSMGGKTAMIFAIKHPSFVHKLVIADISPKRYPPRHLEILTALNSVNLKQINSRQQVEENLKNQISDLGVIQFLMKSLYWINLDAKQLAWRFNLATISDKINNVNVGFEEMTESCDVPTLFIRGDKSNYVLDEDFELITNLFPQAKVISLPNAGHWLHAEAPEMFLQSLLKFIN